ncbi:hypothetical protein OF864_22640 [Bacillus cereus]|uniref:helix-turn-helix domain-containing protein n=1 Tax=Bacillus TaxID=1386 RepID=UPI0020D26EB8|nr:MULTISPECIES: helix-turn-helix domain-containing protein [Bacillus cereus group]WHS74589.1 hypothetical protein OF864_22640 [Bacillus cereus]
MKFVAFPVKMGDSFLLKDEDFSLLVDGGDGGTKIINYITEYTSYLDVILCTHYDKDHIQGLLDLLEYVFYKKIFIARFYRRNRIFHKKLWEDLFFIGIGEIWLPDIFGRIQYFEEIKKDKDNYVRDEGKESVKKDNRENENAGKISVSMEGDTIYIKGRNGEVYTAGKEDFDMSIKIICRLVNYCYILREYFPLDIRWFSYTGQYEEKEYGPNLYALNCKEVSRDTRLYKSKDELVFDYLTRINTESLSFRYNKAGGAGLLPNVLFTADSSFAFFRDEPNEEEKEIVLINNGISIVTTPHHGSANPEHKNVYKILKGKDFIFVRSSERHNSRPVEYYKQHDKSKRFCVRCGPRKSSYDEQKVCLEFENGKWHPGPNVKSCTCGENIFKELGAKHSEELVSFLQEELLTPIEVGEMLGLSRPKIYKMINENKLVPFKTIGNTKIFLRHYIEMKKKELENL